MSAAQLEASERFIQAMGSMVNDEEKVTRVVSLIDYMRTHDQQLSLITDEELQQCMPLDVAMDKLRDHIHARFQARV